MEEFILHIPKFEKNNQSITYGRDNKITIDSIGNINFEGDSISAIIYFLDLVKRSKNCVVFYNFLKVGFVDEKVLISFVGEPNTKTDSFEKFRKLVFSIEKNKVFI